MEKQLGQQDMSRDAACAPHRLHDNVVSAMEEGDDTSRAAYTSDQIDEFIASFADSDLADIFYPSSSGERRGNIKISAVAKRICAECVVQTVCLEAGLNDKYGIWGGLTESERASLKRKQSRRTPPSRAA